jgi:Leucine Rich Repeat (LRR) protein
MQANHLAPREKPQSVAPRRRGFSFSLRSLLIAVLVLGVFCGWVGNFLIRARRQQAVLATIREMGGDIDGLNLRRNFTQFPGEYAPGPRFLRSLFGDAAFVDIEHVSFPQDATDEQLAKLVGLPHLKDVDVQGPAITDVGLKYLTKLPALRRLSVGKPTITANGIGQLREAPALRELWLWGPTITDETIESLGELSTLTGLMLARCKVTSNGLAPVARLTGLEFLMIHDVSDIDDTAMQYVGSLRNLKHLMLVEVGIGDEGFEQIEQLRGLEELDVFFCQITDSGLQHVAPLKNLTRLALRSPTIGDAGIAEIRTLPRLVELSIRCGQATDLSCEHLIELNKGGQLLRLDLCGTQISKPAVLSLSQRMPVCRIQWNDPAGGPTTFIKNGRELQ